ncbi:MAG: hypothetical protein IPI81_06410 [Flavobacteriales bacterium]|nr:hypothetical protein [Flavobacteriales bacterium]MCC6937258.1 hypothetical protein [Flavobacteriales bacterium]
MKLILEIPDNKAELMLDILNSLSFVKTTETLSPAKAQRIANIKEAVRELILIKKGQKKPVLLKDVLDEI